MDGNNSIYGTWTRIMAVDDAIRSTVGRAGEAQYRGGAVWE